MSRADGRNKEFQKPPNEESVKEIREHHAVELRKKKRNECVRKKRATLEDRSDFPLNSKAFYQRTEEMEELSGFPRIETSGLHETHEIIKMLKESSQEKMIERLLLKLKQITGRLANFNYSMIFDEELTAKFMWILQSNVINLQNSALWIMINAMHSSGKAIDLFLSKGLLSLLYLIMTQVTCPDIIENCIWIIGNITSESIKLRDLILSKGFCPLLLEFSHNCDPGIRKIAYWAILNLCSYKPLPELESCRGIIAIVKEGLNSEDLEIIENCSWIAFYLSDSHPEILTYLINNSIIQDFIDILTKKEAEILIPALKVLGNIARGTDKQTQVLIDLGFLEKSPHLLKHRNINIKTEALYIFSNILASTDEIRLKVIKSPCGEIITEEMFSAMFDIKKFAIFAICNATYTKEIQVISHLLELNSIEGLVKGLDDNNANIKLEIVKSIKNLCKVVYHVMSNEAWNELVDRFHRVDGVSKLQDLKAQSFYKIQKEAGEALEYFEENYFSGVSSNETGFFSFN